ncbi:MAG TPA: SRPBCC family protein [Gaiellaceae bacterium]|nr:SRPBCC family protein [Gaiellaceae bacterium]
MPRYEARRTLPAPVEEVWAVLADPTRWPQWWPGLVGAESSVRRALAPGAHWQLQGTERPSYRRRAQLGGSLLVLEVVPLERIAFQLTGEHAEVELDLVSVEDDETQATLAVEAPRFGGIGRTVPSQALEGLAALVRPAAAD